MHHGEDDSNGETSIRIAYQLYCANSIADFREGSKGRERLAEQASLSAHFRFVGGVLLSGGCAQ